MDINTQFTRRLLSIAHEDIRKAFPGVNVRTAASVVGPHGSKARPQFFVQIHVDGFPPHDTYQIASDRYEARAKAWSEFFDKHAPDQIKRQVAAEAGL